MTDIIPGVPAPTSNGYVNPAWNTPTSTTTPATGPMNPTTTGVGLGSGFYTPPAGTAATSAQQDANAIIQQLLQSAGLGSLSGWAWQQIVAGATPAQIELLLPQQPAFQQAFPEYAALQQQGRPMTVAEIMAYRQGATQLAQRYGLPQGFLSNQQVSNLLTRNVSLAELQDRIQMASDAAFNANPDTRQRFLDFYGSHGDLTAYFLDPTVAEPLIQKQYQAAQIAAEARRTSYGDINQQQAEALAAQGVNASDAGKGFQTLAQNRELFNPLNAGEDTIGQEDQLSAAFGNNAAAQERIRRRAAQRAAANQAGGDFAATKAGLTGLGTSDTTI